MGAYQVVPHRSIVNTLVFALGEGNVLEGFEYKSVQKEACLSRSG